MKTALAFYFTLAATLIFTGCETTIPETDTTPPELRFEITIPGHGTEVVTSDEDTEFLKINLPENTRCTFRCTASDQGGLRLFQMQYGSYVTISGVGSEFDIRALSPLSNMMEWTGDEDNPTTGAVATGDMHTTTLDGSPVLGDHLRIYASDFGGRSETRNNTRMDFTLNVVDDSQPIGRGSTE